MSMNRATEILALAGLAPSMLERERLRGEREAANAQQWSSTIQALAPLLVDTGTKAVGALEAEEARKAGNAAQALVARNVDNAGERLAGPVPLGGAPEYSARPGDIAAKAVAEAPELKGPTKANTGHWLSNLVSDLGTDFLGTRSRAYENARATALQGVTSEVKAARAAAQGREDRAQDLEVKRAFAPAEKQPGAADAAAAAEKASRRDKMYGRMLESGDPAKIRLIPVDWLEENGVAGILDALPPVTPSMSTGAGGTSTRSRIQQERLRALELQNEKRAAQLNPPTSPIPEGFRPTTTMTTDLQKDRQKALKAKAASDAIRALIQQYPDLESYVGPLDAVAGWLAKKTGMQSKDAARIRATLGRLFDDYRVAVTGAGASIKEMGALQDNVPNQTDSLDAILGKLQTSDDILSSSLPLIDSILETGDLRGAYPSTSGGMPSPQPSSSGASGSWGSPPDAPSSAPRPRKPLYPTK